VARYDCAQRSEHGFVGIAVPLYEVQQTNRSLLLRRALSAQPRLALMTALSHPWEYLPKPAPADGAADSATSTAGTSKRSRDKRKAVATSSAARQDEHSLTNSTSSEIYAAEV